MGVEEDRGIDWRMLLAFAGVFLVLVTTAPWLLILLFFIFLIYVFWRQRKEAEV